MRTPRDNPRATNPVSAKMWLRKKTAYAAIAASKYPLRWRETLNTPLYPRDHPANLRQSDQRWTHKALRHRLLSPII
jgi:hypothetical protein